ncbi:AtpZ/AtpI family protein [Marimonas lutisalis]|uniref:AtpZ/AtpI family protein n=1 Tax=Marimonas lutisalis TaxID=2545756 RepID=UPI0010F46205|nr:AtpZ/AtpI family protein [Marimonas lutisalis]
MSEEDQEGRQHMQDAIRLRQARRKTWESEGERPLWQNLSMIGALGWLIVIPVLIGVFAGRWLDDRLGTGVTLSGALTFAGAGLGFYLAWRRMNEK